MSENDRPKLYRECPRCNGTGRVPDSSFLWGAASSHCEVPCPDCRMVRVVEVSYEDARWLVATEDGRRTSNLLPIDNVDFDDD